jgi:hypothetical protein
VGLPNSQQLFPTSPLLGSARKTSKPNQLRHFRLRRLQQEQALHPNQRNLDLQLPPAIMKSLLSLLRSTKKAVQALYPRAVHPANRKKLRLNKSNNLQHLLAAAREMLLSSPLLLPIKFRRLISLHPRRHLPHRERQYQRSCR